MVTAPSIQWKEYDKTVDPSGTRHLETTGFLKQIGTGAGEQFDFGSVDISDSSQISDTKLCLAHVTNFNGASGIFNMRFFLNNISAFGLGTYRFLERKEFHFQGDIDLDLSDDDIPTTIPSSPNIKGTIAALFPNGQTAISGVGDQDVTQYVYLAVSVGTDVPVGTYGGPAQGTFRYSLVYDFA
jgi:hypothetical protein